jgi:hypothetical protein
VYAADEQRNVDPGKAAVLLKTARAARANVELDRQAIARITFAPAHKI